MEDWVATLKARKKKLDPYRETILTWLKEHPDLTGAQIHDWLDERCDYKMVSENTVSNFVNGVREFLSHSENSQRAHLQCDGRASNGISGTS